MRWIFHMTVFILFVALSTGCLRSGGSEARPKEQDLLKLKAAEGNSAKKVILLLVDSLMYQSIDQGIKENKLPAFQYLIQHGQYFKDVVSSFPTMSVTIDSSLITGTYPDQHRVPGLLWYSEEEGRLINYGTGPMEVLRQGADSVIRDTLIHLNSKHLSGRTSTIYEELKRNGLTSGSINGIMYRGPAEHKLTIPKWMEIPTTLPPEISVKGPDFLSFGAFSNPLQDAVNLPDGPIRKLGFNNEYAVKSTAYLIQQGKLPDFLYVYLPDLDQKLHKNGPGELEGVIQVDSQLQTVLNAFGSPEQALEQAVFIISGDSGMSQIKESGEQPIIDLTKVLSGYKIMRPEEDGSEQRDLALAVNETMAYVYKLNPQISTKQMVNSLHQDSRIDLISWKEGDWIYVTKAGGSDVFKFKPGGPLQDSYGQSWTIGPYPEVMDVTVHEGGSKLEYGDYPDGMKRLSAALNSHEGDFLVVTAREGYELVGHSSPTHRGGGGHGSFHRTESLIPLIISGTKKQPQHRRLVDLNPFIVDLLTENQGERKMEGTR